jgi:magnesium-transporting ATPase (P-type)
MSMEHLGKILIFAGIILIIAGLLVYFAGSKLGWIGHLPGDIRIVKENVRFYFPITTMILISVVLSVIVWLVRKLF